MLEHNFHLSTLVNGRSTEKFKPSKGLRQGDSLSPYLFLLVVEVLSKFLNDAVQKGQISGFQVVENGLMISHLQFADDTLIFIDASVKEVRRLFIILSIFESLTGLNLNLDKSTMVSVGADDIIEDLAKELGCKTEKLPINYLGMPIGAHWRSTSVWDQVLIRMKQRLATWKKKIYSRNKQALWRRLVQQKFAVQQDILMPATDNKARCRSLWKNVVNVVTDLQGFCQFTVKNVADMVVSNGWKNNFKKILDVNEKLECDLLRRDLGNTHVFVEEEDELHIVQHFTAKKCYDALMGELEPCQFHRHLWKSNIPNKGLLLDCLIPGLRMFFMAGEGKSGKLYIMMFAGSFGMRETVECLEEDIRTLLKIEI
ncbi:uncharacterized protein LOC113341576 [Papaver somniferum]|uniref:uncharacterized protein LOC113341576 n=1 Tax=Papaver somniferum TaxID=3469 RepID=UPI000E6FFCD7|nr:uncharacterized protein LOC113341576 [Papaver somniferum]